MSLEEAARCVVGSLTNKSLRCIRKLNLGVMTIKYVVVFEDQKRWVLRFYPKNRNLVLDFEPDLLRRCVTEKGLAVPRVVGDSRTGPSAPLPYVVYEMIPGEPLSRHIGKIDDFALKQISKELVSFVCKFGDMPTEGWGDLVDAWHGNSPTWDSFLIKTYNEGMQAIRKNTLYDDIAAKLDNILSCIEKYSCQLGQKLAWGDLSPDNVIIDSAGKFQGVIDLEGTIISDPLLSLGYLQARGVESRFYQAIASSWPDEFTFERRIQANIFAVVRLLRILKFINEPLPTGASRSSLRLFFPGSLRALDALRAL